MRHIANLKAWVLREAKNEPIESIVIGSDDSGDSERWSTIPRQRLLTWDEAAPYLDFEFDSGFGLPGCPPLYAWTKNRVIVIGEYDGATSATAIPRHPIACDPTYA